MSNVSTQLKRLAELHRGGILTDQEFSIAKQRVLTSDGDGGQAASPNAVVPPDIDDTEPYWHNSSTGEPTWNDPGTQGASVRQNPVAAQVVVCARPVFALDIAGAPRGLAVEQDLIGISFPYPFFRMCT